MAVQRLLCPGCHCISGCATCTPASAGCAGCHSPPVFSRLHSSNRNTVLLKTCSRSNVCELSPATPFLSRLPNHTLSPAGCGSAVGAPVLGSLHKGNVKALLLQGCFFNDMRGKTDAAGDVVQPALDYSEPIRRFCASRGIACPPGPASACRHQPPSDAHLPPVPSPSAPSTAPPDTDLLPEHPTAAGDARGRQPHAAAAAVPPAAGAELPTSAGGRAASEAPAAAGATGLQADGTAPAADGAPRSGSGTPADEELVRRGIPSTGSEGQWQLPEVPGHCTAAMEHTRISDLFLRVRFYRAGCCSSFNPACCHDRYRCDPGLGLHQRALQQDQMRRFSKASGMAAPRHVTPPATGQQACAAGLRLYERCQARKEPLPALFLSHAAVKRASQLPQQLIFQPMHRYTCVTTDGKRSFLKEHLCETY